MSTAHEQHPGHAAAERLILVSAVAWIAHVAVSYTLAALHCDRHFLEGDVLGIGSLRAVLLSLTALAATVVMLVGMRSLRAWRLLADDDTGPNGRKALSYVLAASVSALALLYLLWSLAPTVAGNICA
jgi:hypothetical protein